MSQKWLGICALQPASRRGATSGVYSHSRLAPHRPQIGLRHQRRRRRRRRSDTTAKASRATPCFDNIFQPRGGLPRQASSSIAESLARSLRVAGTRCRGGDRQVPSGRPPAGCSDQGRAFAYTRGFLQGPGLGLGLGRSVGPGPTRLVGKG